MKLIVVGGVAAGASAAVKARRTTENCEIVIYEKGANISYANCGMPYFIGGTIKERDELLVVTKEYLKRRFNIEVRCNSLVKELLPQKKKIVIEDVLTGNIYEDCYDKLIIATGAEPITPPSLQGDKVFQLYTLSDMDRIKEFIQKERPKRALIMGAGFIGIEMAENFQHLNMEVFIVEKAPQILLPFDPEMAKLVEEYLKKQGINVVTGVGVSKIEDDRAYLENGDVIKFDIALSSLGVKPNSSLAKNAGIECGLRGAIKVNEFMETSIKDIYACGDVAENFYRINNEVCWIPLAGSANKQGRIAGFNAVCSGEKKSYKGTLGTAIAKFHSIVFGATGFNEKQLVEKGISFTSHYLTSEHHAGYYPGGQPLYIKLLGDTKGKLLGAQVVGFEGVDKRVDVFATSIYSGLTFDDLESLDLAYAPPFSSAKDPVIVAGMIGNNIVKGEVKTLSKLPENITDFVLLDVRTKVENKVGALKGAVNIPIDEIRKRVHELEAYKDKKIIVYCASGYRSYIVTKFLQNSGFKEIFNLSGGYFFNGKR